MTIICGSMGQISTRSPKRAASRAPQAPELLISVPPRSVRPDSVSTTKPLPSRATCFAPSSSISSAPAARAARAKAGPTRRGLACPSLGQ